MLAAHRNVALMSAEQNPVWETSSTVEESRKMIENSNTESDNARQPILKVSMKRRDTDIILGEIIDVMAVG
jgi:hypothetical protein